MVVAMTRPPSIDSPLRRLVMERLAELGISQREAARRSQGLVSQETVAVIVQGRHAYRMKDRTIAGLSLALQVPESRMREAAGMPKTLGPWRLDPKFDRLTPEHRALVESLASALLAMYPDPRDETRPHDARKAR